MKQHRFEIAYTGITGYQIERLLREYGIPVRGRYADKRRIRISVPKAQAAWAEYVMLRAGIQPLGAVDARNAARAERHAPGSLPRAWGVGVRRLDFATLWVDFWGAVLGARGDIWGKRVGRKRD